MQIQKIQFYNLKNNLNHNNLNALSFTKKQVQPDSFINATRRKEKSNGIDLFSVANRIATEKRNQSDIISVATRIVKERNDRINGYIKDSKKELKNLQKTAKAHKKQCLAILKKAQKIGYTNTIDCDDYNITFGEINPKTNKPSTINIWDNGRMVQQYNIISLNPLNIEVCDCELKTFNEEFYITDNGLTAYKAHNKAKNTMELVIPSIYGFYKVEGEWCAKTNSIKKSRELEYIASRRYPSTYSQYDIDGASHYQSDSQTKDWYRKTLNKSDTLSIKV